MASENCSSLEAWTLRPSFSDSWISEAFARDTEALTKALQRSIYNSDSTPNTSKISSLLQFVKAETVIPTSSPTLCTTSVTSSPTFCTTSVISATSSETDCATRARRNPVITPAGKISKRKSRATKKSPTTFITADPSNFRQMVQQVTGISFPASPTIPPILKPEPQRPRNGVQGLPTLDSSAFLLNQVSSFPLNRANFSPVVEAPNLDFQPFQSFPTLESWRIM